MIFADKSTGHHLEYIELLLKLSIEDKDNVYAFQIPFSFKKKLENSFRLCDINSFEIIFFSDFLELDSSRWNYLSRSFRVCRFIKRHLFEHNIDHLVVLSLMNLLPLLPFFFRRDISISGFVYLIYLFRWKKSNWKLRVLDVTKFIILTKSRVVKDIFLVNGSGTDQYLNKLYGTVKFSFLPDPLKYIPLENLNSIDTLLKSNNNQLVISHFGYLSQRKGTIEFLEAIRMLESSSINNYRFILAGEVDEMIFAEFHQLLNVLNGYVDITYFSGFVDDSIIGSICMSSDYIMIPYTNVEQSSGMLGYGAQFKVPVIGPKKGLLGKLIRRYELGILLENVDRFSLKIVLQSLIKSDKVIPSDYLKDNSADRFIDKIKIKISE